MSYKNKHIKTTISFIGLTAMVTASLISMADLAEREGQRAVAALQPTPVYVTAAETTVQTSGSDVMMRRSGKEEIHHTSATYGAARRSHSVTGTL